MRDRTFAAIAVASPRNLPPGAALLGLAPRRNESPVRPTGRARRPRTP